MKSSNSSGRKSEGDPYISNKSPQISDRGQKYKDEIDDDDEGEVLVRNLNGIILQYLESCGLTESYATFYDECRSSGMHIPDQFKSEIDRGISLQDVETLLMHFDQENGDALQELWDVLINMVDMDIGQQSKEVDKIAFYIQVYIALIPYRQGMPEEKKTKSMEKLREYFQSKSEACTTDKEMLSLFALPFVQDPETHPVYGSLFQTAWIRKLRTRIKGLATVLCSPNKLITRENTDLAKMFMQCSNAVRHELKATDGRKVCVLTNTRPIHFTSGVISTPPSSRKGSEDEFGGSQIFERLNDLVVENERYKMEESKYEKQCAQLLNVSLLLAQSLEEAAQGKEVNMDKLRYEVNNCLPMAMQPGDPAIKGMKVPQSQPFSNNQNESNYDSDSSNANNAPEENDEGIMLRENS